MRSQGPWRLCSYSPWTLWQPSTPSRPAWWKPVSRPSSVEKNQELYGVLGLMGVDSQSAAGGIGASEGWGTGLGGLGGAGGSLMGDLAVMVTLLPSLPEAVPGQSPAGEFIFLLDRSGSMECPMDGRDYSPQRIDSAKETLVLLLKSLPLDCYFNVYGFGSLFESFYP
ncbi:unnamed protein product, partial [Lepidochelys kempii]